MSEDTIDSESNIDIEAPVLISSEAVKRLNSEGMRYKWKPLQIVDEGRIAIA